MPNDNLLAPTRNQDLATMPFPAALDAYTPNFAAALPSHIPVERFKRTVITAVNNNPDLRYADRRTLFNACVKCAHDGLYPDGREAALVTFKTKVRDLDGGPDRWIDAVQYLPMIAGIRKRMRNTGEVLSATAEIVYRNDKFRVTKGEDPRIEHEPPAFTEARGEPIGAYAIIKLANGETLREVMSKPEIERARAVSKSGQKPGSPWVAWWDEMARKTVLRRCAKSAPTGSDLDRLLARDDEPIEMPRIEDLREPPARPRREDFIETAEAFDEDTGEIAGDEQHPAEPDRSQRYLQPLVDDPPPAAGAAAREIVRERLEASVAELDDKLPAIEIVKPPGGRADWEATQRALVAAFLDLKTREACERFRVANSATLQALRKMGAPELHEAFEDNAGAHERELRGVEEG